MAVIENQQYHILGHNYTSEAGRDKILMSIPRFLGTSNPMVASKNLYVCQPSWNPRWRPLLTHFWLFGDNFTYRTDRDKILMSIPRFSGTSNPMVASKKIYVCQPSWNPRWLLYSDHLCWSFARNFTYRTDGDEILMSVHMF